MCHVNGGHENSIENCSEYEESNKCVWVGVCVDLCDGVKILKHLHEA